MAYSRDAFTRDLRETKENLERDQRQTRFGAMRARESQRGDMELFRQLDYKLTN